MSTSLLQQAVARHGAEAVFKAIPAEKHEELLYQWGAWARPNQFAPAGNWRYWFIRAGRGFGKTRTAAEWIRERVSRGARRIALAGPTDDHIRHKMIEDPESGLLRVFPPHEKPVYRPGLKKVFFHTGAVAELYSAIKPDRARGSQQDTLWGDEVSSWAYEDALTQLKFGLRIRCPGGPRGVFSSTPKRNKITRKLLKDPNTVVTTGSTYDNLPNLAPEFVEEVIAEFADTRLGQQEIWGRMLEDNPDALWNDALIDANRFRGEPDVIRIGVGVDPPGSTAECGIVCAALGEDGRGYVLDDASLKGKPAVWARAAVDTALDWDADFIVAEKNHGGDMVKHTIESVLEDDEEIKIIEVWASRGKATRAEPIATKYEKGNVRHVGAFPKLEDQMCDWVPGDDESPDRMDALVWILTELLIGTKKKKPKAVKVNAEPQLEPLHERF